MGRYFWMQCKRLLRFLPAALLAVLLLLGGLLTAFSFLMRQSADSQEQQRFPIAIAGYTEDTFLQMGLTALEAFDSTRFALQILQMEEAEAAQALKNGDIAAYVVVPEGFVDTALRGQILPLKFVSTTGAAGLVSIFKEEVTKVISCLLLYSQKGVVGMIDAHYDNGLSQQLGARIDQLSFLYVDYVFARDNLYSLQELGIADSLGLSEYLLCGLSVLLLLLACLPFAPLVVRTDHSLTKMLAARGRPALLQIVCDFAAYWIGLGLLMAAVLALCTPLAGDLLPVAALWKGWPVVLLAAAFSFMLYSLCRELIGGVLLQFFSTLALCFVCGCMYPAYFFPVAVQQLGEFLPAGAARSLLAGCLTGTTPPRATALVFGYSVVFFAIGAWVKLAKLKEVAR